MKSPDVSNTSSFNSPVTPQIFEFHLNSTKQIIDYLGAIARVQLGLIASPNSLSTDTIFRVKTGNGDPTSISVLYNGKHYYVEPDLTGADPSSQIIELLVELLAMETSANSSSQLEHIGYDARPRRVAELMRFSTAP
jgi:hypothetical protein